MPGPGTSTLIVNAGSSSVKMRLYHGKDPLFDGLIDGIGGDALIETSFSYGKKKGVKNARVGSALSEAQAIKMRVPNYETAGRIIIEMLNTFSNPETVKTIVHRVVHGGDFRTPQEITPRVLQKLEALSERAPLHQPPSLALIRFFMKQMKTRHIACFDTAFHRTMPLEARRYALPPTLTAKYGIERHGFHGLSHASLYTQLSKKCVKKYSRVITAQLGNGVSLCAIKDGKSIDTTMGFTPLEGLPMGTRSGNIDPALVAFLCAHEKKTPSAVLKILENESGFLGLTGTWDVRVILGRVRHGEKRALEAIDFFAYHVRKQIGAYVAALGGLDALSLGGGLARSKVIRDKILDGLDKFGIIPDTKRLGDESPVKLSKGKTKVWVFETDEQEYMYEITRGM